MTPREYKKLTEAEMRAKRWRLTGDVCTKGGDSIKAWSEVTVFRKFSGVHIRSLPCEHCGAAVAVRGLNPWMVEEITEEGGNVATGE